MIFMAYLFKMSSLLEAIVRKQSYWRLFNPITFTLTKSHHNRKKNESENEKGNRYTLNKLPKLLRSDPIQVFWLAYISFCYFLLLKHFQMGLPVGILQYDNHQRLRSWCRILWFLWLIYKVIRGTFFHWTHLYPDRLEHHL